MITKEFIEEKYVEWITICNKGVDTDPCYMNIFFSRMNLIFFVHLEKRSPHAAASFY